MGTSQTKEKMRSSPSERVVEGLKNKVRSLEREMDEVMRMRDSESQAYERELVVFAFKQAEWKRERKRLKAEVKRLGKALEERADEEERERRRDETVEKWKQLYFAIKLELDHLIQRTTHQEERMCWKTEKEEAVLAELKNEARAKDETIEILRSKVAKLEQQESKREREMDILRQSLRIMSHNSKRGTTKLGQKSVK